MNTLSFIKLNEGWNAEPNVPEESVTIDGDAVILSFVLNPWAHEADEGQRAKLVFANARAWCLGDINDEGWYRGQCRYSAIAPKWGEFYEVVGLDAEEVALTDWQEVRSDSPGNRHFLFYLRDSTFECFAADWRLER